MNEPEYQLLVDEIRRLEHRMVQMELELLSLPGDDEGDEGGDDVPHGASCIGQILAGSGDIQPWTISATNTSTPTVTTGDGYFVTDYDSGTRWDKLTGVSPTITGTGVLVAQLTVDASTSAGTWTTAWVFAACADMDSLPAGAQSDTTHLRRPIWFITRAGSGPYTMTMERVWFGHVTNGMWRPPFA